MNGIVPPFPSGLKLPDHTQLPDSDGAIVQNFREHPQSILLTDAIQPVIQRLYPDERYCLGQDCGIYWRITDLPLRGAVAPDWFLVVGVPPSPRGQFRRSYVMWQEIVAPLVVLEFVSGNGQEERDRTPEAGKFWIYEQGVHAGYYGIYEVDPGRIEMYRLAGGFFEPMAPNERGRYPIPPLGVELGIWQGTYQNHHLPWMRWWDAEGQLLLTGHERAEQQHQRAERLAARLRELGVDPDAV